MKRSFPGVVLVATLFQAGGCSGSGPAPPVNVPAVVLIAIDDLRVDHLSFLGGALDTTPNLTRFAKRATLFEDYVTPSTATPAAIATLLTGVAPAQHGLESMRELGRHRLHRDNVTLAERFAENGWRTLAVVSMRQFSGRLSGFDQGFERYLEDGLDPGGRPLPAAELLRRSAHVLGEELERREPLFLFLQFGDLREGAALPPDPERFFEQYLRPFAGEAGLSAALDAAGPGRLQALEKLLSRRRGSAAWMALQQAKYDARLFELDRQLGVLLERLQAARVREALHVVIVGTRGRYLLESRPDDLPEGLSEGLLRTALIAHLPGILAPGRRSGLCSGERVAATLLKGFPPELAAGLGDDLCDLSAPQAGVELRVLSPRARAYAQVSARHKWILEDGWDADALYVERETDLVIEAPATEFGTRDPHGGRLHVRGSAAEIVVRDASASIRGERAQGARVRLGVDGSKATIELGDAREVSARLYLERRSQALALEFTRDGAALPLDRIRFSAENGEPAGPTIADLPVPRLPSPRAEVWDAPGEEPRPWRVDVVDAGGGWVRLVIPGGGASVQDVRVFAALYPPDDDLSEALRVRVPEGSSDPGSSGGFERLTPESLPGAACLAAKSPLEAEFFLAGRRLALAIEIDGEFVPTRAMRYLGRRFDRGESALFLPFWLPERLDWFLDPAATGARGGDPASSSAPPDGTIWLARGSTAIEGPWDLTLEEVRFLQRLKNE